jgi:hypothetical protein
MKIGRNDPCPCASGKKFKKCCALTAPVVAATAIAEDPTAVTEAPPAADNGHTWVPLQHQARLLRPGNFGRKKPY